VTILLRLPDALSSSGTGYGASINIAAATFAADPSGYLTITLAAPHGLTMLGSARVTRAGASASCSVTGFTDATGAANPNSIRTDVAYWDWFNNDAPINNNQPGVAWDTIEPPPVAGVSSDRWKFCAWGGDQGWPAHVFYYQGRRGYAASVKQPNVVWLTRTNAFNDFSVSTPLIDTDALTFPLNSGKLDSVQGVLPMDKLVMLT
jgi:hypothetical protein